MEGRGGENDGAKDVGEDGGASIAGISAEMTGAGARWTPSLDPYRVVEIRPDLSPLQRSPELYKQTLQPKMIIDTNIYW